MQAPEKRATRHGEEGLETAADQALVQPAPAAAPEEWGHSFWNSLVSFWGSGEHEQRLGSETFLPEDEWDFSAEHGYEPEFEGRSEFEHGEFDRWL